MTVTTDKKSVMSEDEDSVDVPEDAADTDTDQDDLDGAEPEQVEAELEEAEAESGGEPVTGKGGKRLLTGLLVGGLVVALGGAGFLGWSLWQDKLVAQASEQAGAAAVAYAQVLTSIDSDKIDENFDQVLAGATGEFKDMYSESSVQLRQLLIEHKASAHGVVREAAVQSADKDSAVVLLFVDQSVSNTNVPDPRIDRSRIKMTMEKEDGRWRAAKVELP